MTPRDAENRITSVAHPAIGQPLQGMDSFTQIHSSFSSFFDNFPEAIILTDLQGTIAGMNAAAKSLLGEHDSDLGPEAWSRTFGLYLPDGWTLYPAERLPVQRALRGEIVRDVQMILRRLGAEKERWISMDAWLLSAEDGSVNGAVAVLMDITNRKRTEISREKHIERTETLYKLSRVITESNHDLNRLTQAVAILTSTVIGDLSSIMLLHQNNEKMHIAAFYDQDPLARTLIRKLIEATVEFDRTTGLSGKVIQSGEPVLIPSISSEEMKAIAVPEFTEFVDKIGIESVLVVPMRGRTGVIGTMSLSRHRGNPSYTAGDQAFLAEIADRTALAVENWRLVESLRAEISEHGESKQALRFSEERFRSIFAATSLGIKLLDLDGNYLQANPALQEMLGYSESELVGRHLFDFIHPEEALLASKTFNALKFKGESYASFEHRLIRKDSSIVWVNTTYSIIRRGDGSDRPAFVVGMVENVTEQKKAQMVVEEMSRRLQAGVELERLRLAQELHDNPMQMLYAAIYRIEELRRGVAPELRDHLEKVNADLMEVLNGLRSTAKELRPPTIFSFGLENAIRSYIDDVRERQQDLEINLSLAHDRQLLPEKIRLALFRIFQQSVLNVLRHAQATLLEVLFAFDAEEARLEIRDNGKGFVVPTSWIGFVREGHYGLAGAAERVNALGGTLLVESQPGSTTICVVVPWKDAVESSQFEQRLRE